MMIQVRRELYSLGLSGANSDNFGLPAAAAGRTFTEGGAMATEGEDWKIVLREEGQRVADRRAWLKDTGWGCRIPADQAVSRFPAVESGAQPSASA